MSASGPVGAPKSYQPRTCWCAPHPYGVRPDQLPPGSTRRFGTGRVDAQSGGATLLRLLETSIAGGHWKVALRRFLMLIASGIEVPPPLREVCAENLKRCSRRELEKMQADVNAWRAFVRAK